MAEMSEYRKCPFCGGHEFHMTEWWDDDGEYDAVECARCKAAAPADVWNSRVEDMEAERG